jgi:hypothetical protein
LVLVHRSERSRAAAAAPAQGALGMTDTSDTAIKEVYLGDGLYASFDGFALTLRAPREHGDHYVVLEPFVLEVFLEFAQQCLMWKPMSFTP